MLRRITLLLALAAFMQVHAQVNEVGITGGITYYIGDLNPTRHYPKGMHPGGGLVFRHNFNDRYALRFQALYGVLQASDADSPDPLQQLRNLNFRSELFEFSALFEINFFKYRAKGKVGKFWTPFIFGGLAYFRADPKAQLGDDWIRLQPLGTEGQGTTMGGEEYKIDQIAIPFGAGVKFNAGRIDFQIEWGLRRTYTDYIDDVSGKYVNNAQLGFENGPLSGAYADRSALADTGFNTGRARGNTNTRDWYQFTGFSITYILSKFSDCDEQYNWMKRKH